MVHMRDPVYYRAPDGETYRVLDTAWRQGKRYCANPAAPWATTRIFRAKNGRWRFYPLAFLALHPDEHREPTEDMLTIQFQRSERGGKLEPRPLGQRQRSPT